MKNQVIEVLSEEHGKRVIEYWKSRGVETRGKTGCCTKTYNYYGVIDGLFNNYRKQTVQVNNVEIIELPEEKALPRRMLVSNDGIEYKERIVLAKLTGNANYPYIAVVKDFEESYKKGSQYNVITCKYAKEITKVEEMTLEQVCKELGREIKIVK